MRLEDVDTDQQLPRMLARKLLSYVLAHGEVVFSTHGKREMAKDDMSQQDVVNVLRDGQIHEPGEFERGSWRYRCHRRRVCVVVAFEGSAEAVVVTAWRRRR